MTAVTIRSVAAIRRPAAGRLAGIGAAGIISAAVIAVAALAAVFGPLIAPYNTTVPDTTLQFVGPVGGHLLGFDVEGRDVAVETAGRRAVVDGRARSRSW